MAGYYRPPPPVRILTIAKDARSIDSGDITQVKNDLVTALLQDPIPEDVIRMLVKGVLGINRPWRDKYPNPTFADIISDNCKEPAWLDRLITCMSMLEKYGRNLLKSSENRPSGWNNINFNANIFKTKVDVVRGARRVLLDLGYTVVTRVGNAYPPNMEPDRLMVAPLVAELIMVHHELLGYHYNTHPHPTIVDQLLPAHIRKHDPFIKPPFNLPQPTWGSPGRPVGPPEVPSAESSSYSCEICNRVPMWMCAFCENKLLCDGCDHNWHRHPRRDKHHRTHLSPQHLATEMLLPHRSPAINGGIDGTSPGQIRSTPSSTSPGYSRGPSLGDNGAVSCSPQWPSASEQIPPATPAVYVTTPELPTVLDLACTLSSQEGDKLRKQIQEANSGSDADKGCIPSGLPNLSVFLPGTEPIAGASACASNRSHQLSSLECDAETMRINLRLEHLDTEIKEIIRTDPDFFRNARYKAVRTERNREAELLARLNHGSGKDLTEAEIVSMKHDITSPPPVYVPPVFPATSVQRLSPRADSSSKPTDSSNANTVIAPSQSEAYELCPKCRASMSALEKVCMACGQIMPRYADKTCDSNDVLPTSPCQTPSTKQTPPRLRWRCAFCTMFNQPAVKKKCSVCLNETDFPIYVDEDGNEVENPQVGQGMSKSPRMESFAIRIQKKEEHFLNDKLQGGNDWFNTEKPIRRTDPLATPTGKGSTQLWTGAKTLPRRSQSQNTLAGSSQDMELELDFRTMCHSVGSHLSSLPERPQWDREEVLKSEMYRQGKTLVKNMGIAERDGFTPEEFEFAYNHLGEKDDVVSWLRTEWRPRLEQVVLKVAHINSPSMVISPKEASRALMGCAGDVDAAIQKCVHERLEQVANLISQGCCDEGMVHKLLGENAGSEEETLEVFNARTLDEFALRAWDDTDHDRLSNPAFTNMLQNETINKERRLRIILVEGRLQSWGRAENVLRILERSCGVGTPPGPDEDWGGVVLCDIVDVVREVGDFGGAIALLQQQCSVCLSMLPQNKIKSPVCCECKVCGPCLCQHFEICVREKHIRHWVCPVCSQPDIEDEEKRDQNFQFMELLLKNVVKQDVYDLYQKKMRDWCLMTDPNFRWCSNCDFGFLSEGGILKMTCEECGHHTCFQCKKPWEVQHEGITCEQFQAWKEANDPELQTQGVAKILAENGIDCPGCKFRYTIAKGGCMHFTCTQCQHEFCSGCHKPFKRGDTCGKYETCKDEGLHCHHPRDCLYHLRDLNVPQLQKLITEILDPTLTQPTPQAAPRLNPPLVPSENHDIPNLDTSITPTEIYP